MNKKIVAVILFLCSSICVIDLQNTKSYSGEMDVVSAHTISSDNYKEENIIVLLNHDDVTDFETCSYDIIQNVIDDNFQSIRFDWEQSGYPQELTGTVFLSREARSERNPLFSFSYSTDTIGNQYNIKDDPDKYTLKIND